MRKVLLDAHTHTVASGHAYSSLQDILGSDAHISFQIADYERLYPLLAETEFPDELIMNYWPDKFFNYLEIQNQSLF